MASITFAVNNELKSEMAEFSWVNWSELIRRVLLERRRQAEKLLKRLNSKEEQELIRWSVELGRKAKKERFKRVLAEASPKARDELVDSMHPEEREKYE